MGSQGRSGLASRPGRRRRMLLAGLILAGVQAMAATPPTLVVTIHPLLLMATDIAGGVDQGVQLERLIPPHRSPHDYQLPPSRRLVLARADAVVWMGPRLESGLARLLQRLGERGQTLAADVDPHSEADAHDWLDPLAAAAMARRLGALLAQLDERQGDAYRQRAEELALALERSHEAWQYRLQAMQGIRYWVSHDAYGQFEQRYGLSHQAMVALSPERPPGASHVLALQRQLAAEEVDCVFIEPQFHPPVLTRLLSARQIRQVELDPLGADHPAGDSTFLAFWEDFAERFASCAETAAVTGEGG